MDEFKKPYLKLFNSVMDISERLEELAKEQIKLAMELKLVQQQAEEIYISQNEETGR
ncbi:hypothetical protein [Anaerotruncus rubiinfantis]|uniref:hypothetical protein n=1 Tax=Anaerotruncus rubiinfantis TaxID=1720200 RepID=UPI000A953E22|nr:hypothetical protein [Anaerotruncus rubiinfantis]